MPPVEFEPTISAGERPQTYALDRAATGTGNNSTSIINIGIIYNVAHGYSFMFIWKSCQKMYSNKVIFLASDILLK